MLDAGTVRILVDGNPVATYPQAMPIHDKRLLIGADCNSCSGAPNIDFVDGQVDELRVDTRAHADSYFVAQALDGTGGLLRIAAAERLP